MAFTQITNRLDSEKARIEALLAETDPVPTNFQKYVLNKSLSLLAQMRQQTGESDTDYTQRINLEAQKGLPGNWSNSFWSLMDSAVASDTAQGTQGGKARSE